MHNEDIETFEVDGVTVRIVQDEEPTNPRKEYDNFGHMRCWHRRYSLGDNNTMSVEEGKELAEQVEKQGGIVLSLYLYDHSGITMRTSPFSCPWDSGQVGFIYCDKDDIRKNWGVKRVTKKLLKQAEELLERKSKSMTTTSLATATASSLKTRTASIWTHAGASWVM